MPLDRNDARDRELLAALAAGDVHSLGELYDRHAASLFRHALALCRRRPDAEDLVHAVFMKIAAIGAPLLGVRAPAAYLHRALHTAWIDGLRRAAVAEAAVEHTAVEPYAWHAAGDSIDLLRALDGLPPEQREAVVLHVLDGFSFREIGQLTGVSLFTAAARFRIGIRKMRGALGAPEGRLNEHT